MILRVRGLLFEDLRDLYFLFDSITSLLLNDDGVNHWLWRISPGRHLLALIRHLDGFLVGVDFKHYGVSRSYPMWIQLSYLGSLSLSFLLCMKRGLKGHVMQTLDVRCRKWWHRGQCSRSKRPELSMILGRIRIVLPFLDSLSLGTQREAMVRYSFIDGLALNLIVIMDGASVVEFLNGR